MECTKLSHKPRNQNLVLTLNTEPDGEKSKSFGGDKQNKTGESQIASLCQKRAESLFFKDRQGKVSWLNMSKLKVSEIWCSQTQDLLLGASVRLNTWLNEPKHVGPLILRNVASLILQWGRKPYCCWFPHSLIMKRYFYGMCMQTWSRVCQSAERFIHIQPALRVIGSLEPIPGIIRRMRVKSPVLKVYMFTFY